MLSAVGGDVPYRNEKSANLASCLRVVGFVFFRSLAIRGVVSPGHSRCDTLGSQKARSVIRCIKTVDLVQEQVTLTRQKARSAIRCIKTRIILGMKIEAMASSESTERHKVH